MKKEEPKKELFIELKEDIKKLVNDYEHEVGGDGSAIVFAMGYISGRTDNELTALQQLQYLMQAYFFAGVRYAKNYKFDYELVTRDERQKRAEKHIADLKVMQDNVIKQQQAKETAKKQPKQRSDYIG